MRLHSIGVRRFKSLYDTQVPLSDFSVLVGPNGSGKSNMMSAIDFIGETYRYGLEYAVGRAGGIGSIAYRRTKRTTTAVTISIDAELDVHDINDRVYPRHLRPSLKPGHVCRIRHSFSIRPSRSVEDSIFSVAEEMTEVSIGIPGAVELLVSIRTETKSGKRNFNVEFGAADGYEELRDAMASRITKEYDFQQNIESFVEPTELLVTSGASLPFIREFRNRMSRLQVFRLSPNSCRKPGILLPNASLASDGENLPGTLARMRRGATVRSSAAADRWAELVASMSEIFPNLEDIRTGVTSSGDLELQFWEKNVGRHWSVSEVSDGTLQYLALLAVLLDHRSLALVIEEPENALHSWMLRQFLEKCRAVDRAQVLLTTHSPVVLRSIAPSEVLLVWKVSGRSRIQSLVEVDPQSVESYERDGVDVFEQYDSGFLPQTIPAGV